MEIYWAVWVLTGAILGFVGGMLASRDQGTHNGNSGNGVCPSGINNDSASSLGKVHRQVDNRLFVRPVSEEEMSIVLNYYRLGATIYEKRVLDEIIKRVESPCGYNPYQE